MEKKLSRKLRTYLVSENIFLFHFVATFNYKNTPSLYKTLRTRSKVKQRMPAKTKQLIRVSCV